MYVQPWALAWIGNSNVGNYGKRQKEYKVESSKSHKTKKIQVTKVSNEWVNFNLSFSLKVPLPIDAG